MITSLLITGIVILALGLVSYASSKRAAHTSNEVSALSLLPGDIKLRKSQCVLSVLFPVTTSIGSQHDPDAGRHQFCKLLTSQ